jgi:biotin carboxyl carrier protein
MKLQVEINGEPIEVDIKRDGDKVFATVGDREYTLEVGEPENNTLLFRRNGQIFEAIVTQPTSSASPAHVMIRGSEFDISIKDPKRLRGTGGDHSHTGGMVEIKTAMPGKVVRILASVGEEIKKGGGVIVVEAMKMQNEIKSPKDGMVKEVRVGEHDTVNAGQTLVIIE